MPLPLAEARPNKMSIRFLAPDHTPSVGHSSRQPLAAERGQTLTQPVHPDQHVRPDVMTTPYVLREQFDVPSPASDHSQQSRRKGSRAPRPSYSEEQKFHIMYLRIVRSEQWDGIAHVFAKTYGTDAVRSKGGLTSVYYRIRRSWGLRDVLEAQPGDTLEEDLQAVEDRAGNFSRDFLLGIHYPVK